MMIHRNHLMSKRQAMWRHVIPEVKEQPEVPEAAQASHIEAP